MQIILQPRHFAMLPLGGAAGTQGSKFNCRNQTCQAKRLVSSLSSDLLQRGLGSIASELHEIWLTLTNSFGTPTMYYEQGSLPDAERGKEISDMTSVLRWLIN